MLNPIIYRAATMKAASKILKIVKKAPKSDKVVVFLGGQCDDNNEWRKEVKKEFGDQIFFIDPYDSNWEASDNIYDELAGMILSDYVVFYRGGDGTKKEKQFLDLAGDDEYAEFKDLEKLKEYLGRISVKAKTSSQETDMKKHPNREITARLDAVAADIETINPMAALTLDRISDQLEKPVVLPMGWTPGRHGPMQNKRNPWIPGQRFEGNPEPGMGCFQCPGCGCEKQAPMDHRENLCCPNCGGKMAAVNPG